VSSNCPRSRLSLCIDYNLECAETFVLCLGITCHWIWYTYNQLKKGSTCQLKGSNLGNFTSYTLCNICCKSKSSETESLMTKNFVKHHVQFVHNTTVMLVLNYQWSRCNHYGFIDRLLNCTKYKRMCNFHPFLMLPEHVVECQQFVFFQSVFVNYSETPLN